MGDLVMCIGPSSQPCYIHTSANPEGWQNTSKPLVNLPDFFARKALQAKERFLADPSFWEVDRRGNKWPLKGLRFWEVLPSLAQPGTIMSDTELAQKYRGNGFEVVKGMFKFQEGAVGEICGTAGPKISAKHLPTVARAYHCQYAPTAKAREFLIRQGFPGCGKRKTQDTNLMDEGQILSFGFIKQQIGSTTMQDLICDKKGKCVGFKIRQASVITLPELLELIPPSHCTLFSAYVFWLELHKIVKTRLHPSQWLTHRKKRSKKNRRFHRWATSADTRSKPFGGSEAVPPWRQSVVLKPPQPDRRYMSHPSGMPRDVREAAEREAQCGKKGKRARVQTASSSSKG